MLFASAGSLLSTRTYRTVPVLSYHRQHSVYIQGLLNVLSVTEHLKLLSCLLYGCLSQFKCASWRHRRTIAAASCAYVCVPHMQCMRVQCRFKLSFVVLHACRKLHKTSSSNIHQRRMAPKCALSIVLAMVAAMICGTMANDIPLKFCVKDCCGK